MIIESSIKIAAIVTMMTVIIITTIITKKITNIHIITTTTIRTTTILIPTPTPTMNPRFITNGQSVTANSMNITAGA